MQNVNVHNFLPWEKWIQTCLVSTRDWCCCFLFFFFFKPSHSVAKYHRTNGEFTSHLAVIL